MFEIEYAEGVATDLGTLPAHERETILDTIETQLRFEPTVQTRNRKILVGLIPPWEHGRILAPLPRKHGESNRMECGGYDAALERRQLRCRRRGCDRQDTRARELRPRSAWAMFGRQGDAVS